MSRSPRARVFISFLVGALILGASYAVEYFLPARVMLPGGWSLARLVVLLAGAWLAGTVLTLLTMAVMARQGKPVVEGMMVGRLYRLISIVGMVMILAFGFGRLGTFGTVFSMFGGMILGWSLQAPVSGFAAWMLVSVKRPFRPGDRVQFPNLGLTGDVVDVGAMYLTLNQVGGTVGSEEAVGRHILVPSAMLFSQVVINFTVKQEAAFMLDEVVVRITYDSNLSEAEKLLVSAAEDVTGDIIRKTGMKPYIRSDFWDYGLLLRLRFNTNVQDRARIAYEINNRIMQSIQKTPSVDLAIPFIYSYRAGADKRDNDESAPKQDIQQVDLERIQKPSYTADARDVEQLSHSIAAAGLMQPIILAPDSDGKHYSILAGHLRYEACKRLGWRTVPAIIRPMPAQLTFAEPGEQKSVAETYQQG